MISGLSEERSEMVKVRVTQQAGHQSAGGGSHQRRGLHDGRRGKDRDRGEKERGEREEDERSDAGLLACLNVGFDLRRRYDNFEAADQRWPGRADAAVSLYSVLAGDTPHIYTLPLYHSTILSPTMESRGLTLRSKSRRARPQISAPKPISGPLPSNQKPADPAKAQQNDATSDLVKRRYSTRFNQAPDFDAKAPPVPTLPQVPPSLAGLEPPGARPSPDPSHTPKVDLNALRDPSLPVDRCELTQLASYIRI